jgi:large-conductance mechanosensitive channel
MSDKRPIIAKKGLSHERTNRITAAPSATGVGQRVSRFHHARQCRRPRHRHHHRLRLIGFLSGGSRFNNIFITLAGPKAATLADAEKAGAVTLNIGVFMETVLQFLIVSFAMFWLVKGMAYLYSRPAAAPPQSPPKSEVLLEEIRDILTKKLT